jgi:hypothetical protein
MADDIHQDQVRSMFFRDDSRAIDRVPGLVKKVDCGDNGFQLIHRVLAPTRPCGSGSMESQDRLAARSVP